MQCLLRSFAKLYCRLGFCERNVVCVAPSCTPTYTPTTVGNRYILKPGRKGIVMSVATQCSILGMTTCVVGAHVGVVGAHVAYGGSSTLITSPQVATQTPLQFIAAHQSTEEAVASHGVLHVILLYGMLDVHPSITLPHPLVHIQHTLGYAEPHHVASTSAATSVQHDGDQGDALLASDADDAQQLFNTLHAAAAVWRICDGEFCIESVHCLSVSSYTNTLVHVMHSCVPHHPCVHMAPHRHRCSPPLSSSCSYQ